MSRKKNRELSYTKEEKMINRMRIKDQTKDHDDIVSGKRDLQFDAHHLQSLSGSIPFPTTIVRLEWNDEEEKRSYTKKNKGKKRVTNCFNCDLNCE